MIEIKSNSIFDRPIPSAPGKTHGKDIMLLCKGRYNTDKYKTLKDALQRYYEERYQYGEPYDLLSFGFINEVLIRPAIEELLTDRLKYMFIDFIFSDRRVFALYNYRSFESKKLLYDESMYYRITQFLSELSCIELNSDEVLINTDDYWVKDKNGNPDFSLKHHVLIEGIIKD